MKKSMFMAAAALLGALAVVPSAGGVKGGSLEGDSFGTLVVWNNYHSGLPTAHVRGRLIDGTRVVGQFACRLEDDGDVSGVAQTYLGSATCGGRWEIDGNNEGKFEIEIEYADREIEVEAEFKGRREFWAGDWEEEND
jgi:hypothetical protein